VLHAPATAGSRRHRWQTHASAHRDTQSVRCCCSCNVQASCDLFPTGDDETNFRLPRVPPCAWIARAGGEGTRKQPPVTATALRLARRCQVPLSSSPLSSPVSPLSSAQACPQWCAIAENLANAPSAQVNNITSAIRFIDRPFQYTFGRQHTSSSQAAEQDQGQGRFVPRRSVRGVVCLFRRTPVTEYGQGCPKRRHRKKAAELLRQLARWIDPNGYLAAF